MRVRFRGGWKDFRSVWYDGRAVFLIDQTALPFAFRIRRCTSYFDVADSIKLMVVRGAPAIGIAGGFALALAANEAKKKSFGEFHREIERAKAALLRMRPTAVDLRNILERVSAAADAAAGARECAELVEQAARNACEEVVAACARIGQLGEKLMPENARILTHCNAGALASVDHGTALAPVRLAQKRGKAPFVFVSETRPRLQGALTAWELRNEGIAHAVLVDGAAGHFMKRGQIGMCIVGADRICARDGSIANKIGTYEKAVLAKENGIPFYVAAPTTTLDFKSIGSKIPIEERNALEVLRFGRKALFPKGTAARNPAFDVTPRKFITAVITEKGILKPSELRGPHG